jgi:hypothetical protein
MFIFFFSQKHPQVVEINQQYLLIQTIITPLLLNSLGTYEALRIAYSVNKPNFSYVVQWIYMQTQNKDTQKVDSTKKA